MLTPKLPSTNFFFAWREVPASTFAMNSVRNRWCPVRWSRAARARKHPDRVCKRRYPQSLRRVENLPLDVLWPFSLPPLALLRYCPDITSLQPRCERGCNDAMTNLHWTQFKGRTCGERGEHCTTSVTTSPVTHIPAATAAAATGQRGSTPRSFAKSSARD